MATCYLGERSGARILAYGDATTQVGTDFQATLETWDVVPLGPVGDALFRSIDVSLKATAGYSIGITPIVDDVELTEQFFSGSDTGPVACQAFFATRGTRCRAKVRTVSRTGDIELYDVALAFTPLRIVP